MPPFTKNPTALHPQQRSAGIAKKHPLACGLVLCFALSSVCIVQAQQTMPDMPGMQPGNQNAQPTAPPPAARQNHTDQKADPPAGGLERMGQNGGNAKDKAAAASVLQSEQQQKGHAQAKPGAGSDYLSITTPVQVLQEPEAESFHTGSDLPAPELLLDIAGLQPMTVEDFITLADAHNPTLAQAQRNVERSQQQGRQAGLPPDPIVGYSGDHIRGGSYHGGEQGAFFSQEFLLGHKLALRKNIYLAEGRSNELAIDIQRARIHDDVARSFFEALAAQQTVVIHERLLKVAIDRQTNAHELERIGQADAAAVLTAEVSAEQAKVDFVQAQRMFLTNFTQLATFAGQAALAPHPLAGSLLEPPQVDAEALVLADMQQSPAVKQAQANVTLAETRVKSAQRESIPNLTVKAGEWNSGEPLGPGTARAGFESFAEAGVQLPLWNRNQGNAGAARVELERARQEVLRTQLLTRNRAEPFAQQYQAARFKAEKYRTEILPRARRAYELQIMKYQQMALAYSEVLTAQTLLFTLQLTYVQALNQQWGAALALENYALMNGLDEPTSVGHDTTTINLPTGGSN